MIALTGTASAAPAGHYGPHPAYLVRGANDLTDSKGVILWYREWVPCIEAHVRFPNQIYRLNWADSPVRPADRVSLRRLGRHRWGAYIHHGHRLISTFRAA